jgi:hypothetical protein
MTIEEAEARIMELENQIENARKSQAGTDRAYLEAAKKLKQYGDYTPEQIEARIKRVAMVYDAKVKDLELDYFVKGRCLETGIPHDVIKDLKFADQQHAESHLARLAEVFEAKRLDERNQLLTSGQKPQAGAERPKEAPRSLSAIEAMAKASAGILSSK